ncbi:AraC family transcriptional regulator [bacterium]|nr:AraC family transcriptional regulator [bacterium]
MAHIPIKIVKPQHPTLRYMVHKIWMIDSDGSQHIAHKLMPVGNLELICHQGAPAYYQFGGQPGQIFDDWHITGIHQGPRMMRQEGCFRSIGISFTPIGAYTFLGIPASELLNQTVSLSDVSSMSLLHDIEELSFETIEHYLLSWLKTRLLPDALDIKVINNFSPIVMSQSIHEYCQSTGIHPRRLERLFKTYTGITPKAFLRMRRFQKAVNILLGGHYESMTCVALDLDYYDQSHFINEFSGFAGTSPSKFLKEKQSIKELMTVA